MEIQRPPHPQNHLAMAIITTLICCQITGIISIIYASQVNSKYSEGNYEGAIRASQNAKTWWVVGLAIGIIGWIIGLIYSIIVLGFTFASL